MQHFRKTKKRYNSHLNPEMCPFCNPETLKRKVKDFKHSYIVPNLIKYDLWETHPVDEHLLLIPKAHEQSLNNLTKEAQLEIIRIISEYEAKGYNVYARGFGSPRKSVPHQHTHLIKISGKYTRMTFFIKKPYFLFRV